VTSMSLLLFITCEALTVTVNNATGNSYGSPPRLEDTAVMLFRLFADQPARKVAHLMRQRVPNAFCSTRQLIAAWDLSEDTDRHNRESL
jgi:hypothetical protein